ncbi:MAG: hypothetical protein ACO3A2_11150 [Bdellovibrionia bacterium]
MRAQIKAPWFFYFLFLPFLFTSSTQAEIKPESVHLAENKKTQKYVKDGLILGGDQAITDVVVQDIRRAMNPQFERVVIDLMGQNGGEIKTLPRAPYYQIAMQEPENRIVVTVWGQPSLKFNAKKISRAFHGSRVVKNLVLLPKLEEDSWTFALELKPNAQLEVFELANPIRLILDIQQKAAGAPRNRS